MEFEKYWIYEDYFIFKPEFNYELNIYQNMIIKYKNLIFSNYDNYEICIETNNIFENIYIIIIIKVQNLIKYLVIHLII